MAESKILMSAGHGWKKVMTTNGYTGVTIPNDWKELRISSWFGLNVNYGFSDSILREQYDNRVSEFKLIHGGCLNSTNDYHGMILKIEETKVFIETWLFNGGNECASTSTLVVFYRT